MKGKGKKVMGMGDHARTHMKGYKDVTHGHKNLKAGKPCNAKKM